MFDSECRIVGPLQEVSCNPVAPNNNFKDYQSRGINPRKSTFVKVFTELIPLPLGRNLRHMLKQAFDTVKGFYHGVLPEIPAHLLVVAARPSNTESTFEPT